MLNVDLVIEERAANIGNFLVGRLLPFRQKRMIGPFIYIDHMGPVFLSENENFDVLPHPHIGLSTLTFLFEGSIMHRDTLGNEIEIKPGEVNWMTSGKGVVHSERTPEYLRSVSKKMHGLQIWVALPKHLEEREPDFFHLDAGLIPKWSEAGLDYKLIAGELLGRKSPVPVHSPMYMLEINSSKEHFLNLDKHLFGQSGIYILKGGIETGGHEYGSKQLLVSKGNTGCEFTIKAGSTLYIFGGESFPEDRYIDWNFVSSSKDLIMIAKQNWIDRQFDPIKGDDDEFIPYPSAKR